MTVPPPNPDPQASHSNSSFTGRHPLRPLPARQTSPHPPGPRLPRALVSLTPLITLNSVTYTYPDTTAPALRDLSLAVEEGEFLLVVGPSGAGKSTFLRTLNGLVPHFHGGTFWGRIEVAGRDPVRRGPQGMGDVVGLVFQDPEASFVVDTVEDELTFAMENWAVPPHTMRKRVEEVLDLLDIAHLRERPISTLSGGERQRVAIAAVMTLQPRLLVLDEPTSQLDPQAAEEVLIALRHLNEDLGLTVILAEHRLERVVQYADRMLYLSGEGGSLSGPPRDVLARVPLVPPLIELARHLGWSPLPLTIKEGRRFACALRLAPPPRPDPSPAGPPVLEAANVWYTYNGQEALRGVSFTAHAGEFIALMGRNGAGKSTLLKCMTGLLRPSRGDVRVALPNSPRPAWTPVRTLDDALPHVGLVPQNPGRLLFQESVRDELRFTRRNHGLPPDPGADMALLDWLGIAHLADRDPRDLSGGERQRAAIAAVLVADPQIILLDEPTRGLDYDQKAALTALLRDLTGAGRTVIMATHDVELVAQAADRVILMAEGEIVVDGPTRDVMTESLVFASQVTKLFRDPRVLVVRDVLEALGGDP